MKIEKSKSKKSVGDLPTITQELIQSLLTCPEDGLIFQLQSISVWRYGKCELYHWIEVLDRFDAILAKVTDHDPANQQYIYMCLQLREEKIKQLILSVLNFTSLLIEHSYARHIYNSTEHLCMLLASTDLDIVLAVLNLFYVFGKRSNFISRLPAQQRSSLNSYLEYLGETWGGKQNGFGLAQCCQDIPLTGFPETATCVYFEYQPLETSESTSGRQTVSTKSITVDAVDQYSEDVSDIITHLLKAHSVPLVQQMRLLTRLRIAKNFGSFEHRVKCVLVRLQAVSVLVYSMAPAEVVDPLIYDGLVEELIEVLEVKNPALLQEVKAAVLRTLTAIIHLERDPRLGVIIEATGAGTYHGFLPTLVRDCVVAITSAGPDGISASFPLSFATSLFSFLYHLATYEASGDALVSSGIMESLLQVLDWKAVQPMNITLVTRAVRVVDLITNLDMSAFHSLGGWDKMLNRLRQEITECKKEVPNILPSSVKPVEPATDSMDTDQAPPTSLEPEVMVEEGVASEGLQCMPERSALIKSILNFVKKAVPDPTFAENIRNFVDSSLPASLAHIASNAEYYGPSIYLPATEVTTTFIFHDPSQLSSLQDNGLPWIILNSLINKKIPVTREVLSSLPSILSAICLNSRGLQIFIDAQPFDHLFGVLISSDYLPAMRRKRGNDPLGDTASNLGAAMDELMRHQPLLKSSVMLALIRLLKKLCTMGAVTQHPHSSSSGSEVISSAPTSTLKLAEEDGMTSDEEELFEEGSHICEDKADDEEENGKKKRCASSVPLTEYTLNVVNFVDAILSNNSTDDHINEFIEHDGLQPLLSLLSLPALPLNFPSSNACNSITSACKSILNVAHDGRLLSEALSQLSEILDKLKPFMESPDKADGSVLLQEVNSYSCPEQSQLLHYLAAAGGYIQLFIHLSKCSQIESRQICIEFWASPLGQTVLSQLSKLYRSLVWEGFIVLAVASANESSLSSAAGKEEGASKEEVFSSALLEYKPFPGGLASTDAKERKTFIHTLKLFTPPLVVTSRVGRSLAELMSLLVRLCTGPLQRPPRRGPGMTAQPYVPLSENAVSVSLKITDLLLESLTWDVPTPTVDNDVITGSNMKNWLFSGMTFKMYAVDFCLLLLFDEHKQAYHLMLHAFSQKNVLESFIKSFYAALECIDNAQEKSSIVSPSYAVTSDFLEAWLNLAEKLINATAILESSHCLPVPPPSSVPQSEGKKLMFNPLFNPLEFVIKAQKAILPCVQKLWQSVNLNWMMPEVVEHLLITIKHLYSSEKTIESKLVEFRGKESSSNSKSKSDSTSSVSNGPSSSPFVPRVDPLHLQQLMDMGFDRDHAEEALLATGNDLPTSMEWILTHPFSGSNREMSEEEQLAQAIALSLQPSTSSQETSDKMEQDGDQQEVLQPIDRSLLDRFSDELLDGVLSIVPEIEESVYKACDLVTALCRRNGASWRDSALSRVKVKVCATMKSLTERIQDGSYEVKSGTLDPDAFHICLLALLMEEMPLLCASVVCTNDLLSLAVALLACSQEKLSELKRSEHSRLTPLWVSPLLLLLELWLGIESLVTWHRPPAKGCNALWFWFESMNSRWCFFGNDISRTLETAYREGEPVARIQSSRQRYVVQFSNMVQINLDTSTQRPVFRLEIPKKREGRTDEPPQSTEESLDPNSFSVPPWFTTYSNEQAITVVRSCTHLLSAALDTDCLHSNMRLLLCLTRHPLLAKTFMEERGPHALLKLTQNSSFQGFSSLSAILFRHVVEDGPLLEKGMDSIVRSVVSGSNQDSEIKAHGQGRKDLDFVMRRLAPCAARNKDLFVKVFCQVARLANLPPRPEDYYATQRVALTVLKLNPSSSVKSEPLPLSSVQHSLLDLLVDHLCAHAVLNKGGASDQGSTHPAKIDEESFDCVTMPTVQYGSLQNPRVRRSSYRRQVTDDDLRSEDMVLDVDQTPDVSEPVSSSNTRNRGRDAGCSDELGKGVALAQKGEGTQSEEQLLFSQAATLRLLAEMVESYPSTSQLIIESTRKVKIDHHEQNTKEISVIEYVLDHLLPLSYSQGNVAAQVTKLAKVFLQCLATTDLPAATLATFVAEFRASFSRTLQLPESQFKHHRIRALASLLGQIVEPQTGSSSRAAINPTQFVRLLIRKGFITDLAKAVHSLDLSSPLLTTTVNCILKPLECLTKIVTQFVAAQKRAGATGNPPAAQEQQQQQQPVISNPSPRNNGDTTAGTEGTHGSASSTGQVTAPTAVVHVTGETVAAAGTAADVPVSHDVSLIPLQEEEERQEQQHDTSDESLVEEAMSLAHELGVRHGQAVAAALAGGDGDREEDMDLEEIVDELLERGSSQAADATFENSSHGLDSDSDMDEDELDDPDNINSAGEEIEDEFEISHNDNTYYPPSRGRTFSEEPVEEQDADASTSEEDDTNGSAVSTDVVEEEEEEEESENDQSASNIDESLTLEEEGGRVGEEDELFEIAEEFDGDDEDDEEEEEEEEEEDENELVLDYADDDTGMFGGDNDLIHVEFPSWSFGWRDAVDMDGHFFGFPPSFLSRAYHIRSPMSEGAFPSGTLPSLPRQHPLLVRRANPSLAPGVHGALSAATVSASRPDVGPTAPDVQRSNIVQQLLTNISVSVGIDEVLSFSVGGGGASGSNPRQATSALRVADNFDIPSATAGGGVGSGGVASSVQETAESAYIPSSLSRWKDESQALDGHTAHLIIAALRPAILKRLKEEYEKEKKQSMEANSSTGGAGGTATVTVNKPETTTEAIGEQPTPIDQQLAVPNPSDEATPSTTTPRNGSQSVEQLQSSLRAVADALVQTVAQVNDLDHRLPVTQTETTGSADNRSSDPEVNTPHQSTAPPDTEGVARSVASMPDLSSFDGSQDSARAMLSRVSPNDPLYTFLSAVARAPTPPLPESVSEPANISTATPPLPTSTPSPRLPVFTQLLPRDPSSASPVAATIVPVIQDPRSASSTASTVVPDARTPVTAATVPLDSIPTQISQSVLAGSNFADVLASELAQAVSSHLMAAASHHSSSSPSSSVSSTVHTLPVTFAATTGSPSPSDTLAPLMSSLQMPPPTQSPASTTAGEGREVETQRIQAEAIFHLVPARQGSGQSPSTGQGDESSGQSMGVDSQEQPMQTETGQAGTSTAGTANGEGSAESPDGIDPTFLAALPDSIRQEVLAQYEREQQRNRRQTAAAQQQQTAAATPQSTTINPEVLAALPPDIQEEVIQQQRMEQARQSQLQVDPTQPADALSFFTSLTPELRRTVLSDMDDTLISQLPEEIAAEARALRQERENRRRAYIAQQQARYEHMAARMIPTWSHAIPGGAASHYRYAFLSPGDRLVGGAGLLPPAFAHSLVMRDGEAKSKQMLDQESLVCLLVLLFLDQSKLHFNRLFRIFRSLSQHIPSRSWIISSLLAIIREANFMSALPLSHTCPHPPTLTPGRGEHPSPDSSSRHAPQWLNISVNAALGSHAPVFLFSAHGKAPPSVTIHQHASIAICNNTLELLIFLARQFPTSFLPSELLTKDDKTPVSAQTNNVISNFWHILYRLDSAGGRRGKSSAKVFQYAPTANEDAESDLFGQSPVGQLMSLFDHPVVQGSVSLVDKLLRVLSVISGAIPKQGLSRSVSKPVGQAKDSNSSATALDRPSTSGETPVFETPGDGKPTEPPSLLHILSSVAKDSTTPSCFTSSVVSVSLLKSTVALLTSGKCSEDTLDDATSLLINLSRCSITTREAILLILLEGISTIGQSLYTQISTLLNELISSMPSIMRQSSNEDNETTTPKVNSGALGTVEGVVLPTVQGSRTLVDHSSDLHLSCMEPLICKGSQQFFFLRLLKIVCQLRESAQSSNTVLTPGLRSTSTTPSGARHEDRSTTPGNVPLSGQPEYDRIVPTLPAPGDESDIAVVPETATGRIHSLPTLSTQLDLEELWSIVSECLDALAATYDPHAVLALQPIVEAFFLVHAEQSEVARTASRGGGIERRGHSATRRLPSLYLISDTESIPGSPAGASHSEVLSPVPSTPLPGTAGDADIDPYSHLPPDTARFLKFAERHRTVLNQILRQTTVPLSEGPFGVLVNHTRLLDFDVKRRYFRQELEQMDEGLRREDLVVHIRRSHVFEDSYRELYRRSSEEMKANLYITFDGEEGQDAGGLLREWYIIIAREMFDPNYALFKTTPGDRVTYMPNPSSHVNPEHLNYFKFVGRIIAKAIYDNKLLDCYFTRSFYKHILGKPVHYTDMESEDYSFYQGMVYLLEHDISDMGLELTFSTEIEEFGKTETRDLKPNGRELPVSEANKREYVQLACQMKMTGSIRSQIKSFLEGFYDVIPKDLISIFNEQELELLISGLPNIDIDDLKANTEYHKYTETSLQIQWFWRALRSCSQSDRARFLQFVTGTSKVPLQGFAALEGMNGIQKFQIHRDDRSTDRLPSAHTCFNQLDLPPYETYDKLQQMLLIAIRECPEGFGFA